MDGKQKEKNYHLVLELFLRFAFLIRALTEPGDGIIIQRPVYYPLTIKIENAGRRVVNNPLIHDGNTYRMDYIDLEEKLKNPQNKGIN